MIIYLTYIFQDEAPREVTSFGTTKMVRNIQLTDPTGSIRTALWEQAAQSDIKVGSRVKLTYMAVRHDPLYNETAIQSTTKTEIKVIQSPNLQYILNSAILYT